MGFKKGSFISRCLCEPYSNAYDGCTTGFCAVHEK